VVARVLALWLDPRLEVFEDGLLKEFLTGRRVFRIRDHFFVRNEVPQVAAD